ncbi:hypothetical protein BGZ98_002043 [Dissophora globulifera]|nr:hypothetical protein BGZ98_002043 [Dissophora globulifera]
MNAVAIALSSQDIVHQILSLDSLTPADLRACCLVNSDWAAAGLFLLWRYPKCHSLHSFCLLFDTLRHEVDFSGPVASVVASRTLRGSKTEATVATLQHSVTLREFPSSLPFPDASVIPSLVPTPYRPFQLPKEYGIPFHGQRIYHRAQFIRHIDFNALAGAISIHHFEILARSSKVGFRSLDLRKVQIPFSGYLLSILINSKSLRQLALCNMHIPLDALVFLEPCFRCLVELRLINCPNSMGDAELSQILKYCSQLQVLEIRGESFTDESLCWISKTCHKLETLVVEVPRLTDTVIKKIAKSCVHITSWSFINCAALSDMTAETLKRTCIAARNSTFPPGNGQMAANSAWTGNHGNGVLDTLSLQVGHIQLSTTSDLIGKGGGIVSGSLAYSSSTLSLLSASSIYSHINVDSSWPPSSSRPRLTHSPSFALDRYASTLKDYTATSGMLSSINLRNCTSIDPQAISLLLRSHPRLEHLTLGGSAITDDALYSLTETPFTRLRSLALLDCGEISDETMVAVMFNCDQIRKLTIFGSTFTLRTFSSISLHLCDLEELHLEHVPLIMTESLQDILVKCMHLRKLKLWHCRNLTQDLFTDLWTPCSNLSELEYMDKFLRPCADDGWEAQVVRFLRSLVIRFEKLKILRLTKLADTWVPVNLVSYLCQLDRLEQFTILQNPGLDLRDLKELKEDLPSLIHIGVGISETLSVEQLNEFAKSNHRPGVLMYGRMIESSEELEKYVP